MKNTLVAVAIMVSFCIGFAYSSAITYSDKYISTVKDMSILARSVKKYFETTQKMPTSLADLVESGIVEASRCKDRWGGNIEYTIIDEKVVALFSKGNPNLLDWPEVECGIKFTFFVDENDREMTRVKDDEKLDCSKERCK